MKQGNKKLFLDKQKLYQLVNLRLNGWAVDSLAVLFDCDESSIRHQLYKYEMNRPIKIYTVARIINISIPAPKVTQWRVINGERYNIGKSYKDYLNISP